jgi:hypothetical protein
MPTIVLFAVLGSFLVAQGTVGRLGARLLSHREYRAGETTPGAARPAGFVPISTAGGSSSGTLTIDQVARVAIDAGLTPEQAAIATAIAMVESGGRLDAHNPVWPDDSWGLWQINRLAHPQFTEAELVTAAGNARAMLIVSNHGTSWRGPWAGSYSKAMANLAGARAAVSRVTRKGISI